MWDSRTAVGRTSRLALASRAIITVMRQWGGLIVLVGVIGFFYCGDRVAKAPPLPEGLSVTRTLRQPAGPWIVGRFVCACVAASGAVILLFARNR